jgi:hypothetical protein
MMSTPTKLKKSKKVKKTKPRKAQPLPRSVQALLKYLGGSDVRVGGGARGGQPATLAPTSINIAVSQQQAQQQAQAQAQQQQFVQQRVAPKGQVISQSPLAAVAAQPIIIQNAPQRRIDYERIDEDKERQAREAETRQNELNRRFGVLEASQEQFKQQAVQAYQDVKQDINRRVAGDANIFDARNIAARFASKQRPVVEEVQLPGVQVGEEAPVEWTDITEQGIYQAGQYLANVTNPEMTQIERAKRRGAVAKTPSRGRGRPSKAELAASRPEYVKEFAMEVAEFKRKTGMSKLPAAADVATLVEGLSPSTIASYTPVPSSAPAPAPKTRMILVKKKPVSTTGAPDMASQIAMLTGGGAALPPQSKGQNIAELLGATKK